jgi:uncharacterized protein YciI
MNACIRKVVLAGALGFGTLPAAKTATDDSLAAYFPTTMKPYYLDMLLSDKSDSTLSEAEQHQWKQKHLAYVRAQVEKGNFVLVGPLTEENRLRGIAVIKAASLEEAKRIASGEPLVQAGRFTAEVHPIMLEDLSAIRFDYPPLK